MGNKIQKIYIGSSLVRPKWHPGANTIAYYPLNGDVNDYSGNNRNLTAYNVTYDTLSSGDKVAYFNGSSAYAMLTGVSIDISEGTQNVWIKKSRSKAGEMPVGLQVSGTNDGRWSIYAFSTPTGNIGHDLYYNSNIFAGYNNTGIANGTWINVVSVVGSSGNKLYVNGQEVTLSYNKGSASTAFGTRNFNVICLSRHQTSSADRFQGDVSKWIVENTARTADEIADYYNSTKGNYGL